ncbi:AAA family ATPase [Yersinia ruckeri]|nr:AAA family ATPase [Yersinia ruckeri]PHZ19304.1 AAA family ATPase [Yersinia ruckeri]
MEKKAHRKMGQKFPRQQPVSFQIVDVLATLVHRLPTP